jgi:hypothetical protein
LHTTSVKQCGRSSIFQLYGSRPGEAVAEYFYTMFGGGSTGRFRTRRILKPKTALFRSDTSHFFSQD